MQAVAWMSGTLVSFCLMAIGIRELSGDVPVWQTLFVRSLVGVLCISTILLITNQLALIKTKKIALHLFRNTFHLAGQYGWFFGIGLLPLAQVFALEFTVPFWTAIIAAMFLNEKINARRICSIALGLAGVLLIVQPGVAIVDAASLIVLAAAVCYAVAHTSTKALLSSEEPIVIIFYMCLVQLPVAFSSALFSWVWPDSYQWSWLMLIALTALSAHYCMAKAMQHAEVTTVVTIDFLRLPLVAILGVLLYQEKFEFVIMLGGCLMLLGNLINVKSASIPAPITSTHRDRDGANRVCSVEHHGE